MRGVDEPGERQDVALFQSLCGLADALAFLHDVGGAVEQLSVQNVLCALKLFGGDIRKARGVGEEGAEELQRSVHFGAALVVFARDERVRLVAVGDDELIAAELEGDVFIVERLAVEQDRLILFSHCRGETDP